MNTMFGYGCVIRQRTKEIKIENTKAFKDLRNLFLPEDAIHIDIIESSNSSRPVLETILHQMNPCDVLVITHITSLGTTGKDIFQQYQRVLLQDNFVLIPNYNNENALDEYSTSNFGMKPVKSPQEIKKMLAKLESAGRFSESNRGNKEIELTEDFKKIYWLYEQYLINEATACKNKYFNMSVNTFRRLCGNYENLIKRSIENGESVCEYIYLQEQKEIHQISKLPKRYGKVPVNFQELIQLVDNGIPAEIASEQLSITPVMDETLYKRFFLKNMGGKKILARTASINLSSETIEKVSN